MAKTIRNIWIAVALLAVSGCMGSGEDAFAANTSDLLEGDITAPLEAAPQSWADAPAGCEGRLSAELSFRVASTEDGLIAAVDRDGSVVCVDTIESVEVELHEEGRDEEADALRARYLLTAEGQRAIVFGDPSPQPSTQPISGPDPGGIPIEFEPAPSSF